MMAVGLVDSINDILPQTQCTKCGFSGCRPYAEAIVEGAADINQCPPGGSAGIRALAELLDREVKPLSIEHGIEKPREVALIDESVCIGCTKCILACPVDAILGASKLMHTVLVDECTGCELCVAPCPVDCISMHVVADFHAPVPVPPPRSTSADYARRRYEARQSRLARDLSERTARLEARRAEPGVAADRHHAGAAAGPAK